MERVIRIQSQQSGNFNLNNNLVDFVIPPGQYNFRDSYMELMATIQSSDGKVYPVQMNYIQNGEDSYARPGSSFTPNSKWVRRSRVRSNLQGVLEEIQDNDILRQNVSLYTKGLRETADTAHLSASQIQDVVRNTRAGIFTELRKDKELPSSYRNTPINIPLKEIFEIGGMPLCPVDKMGGLHLNLELNAGDKAETPVGNWSVVGLSMPTALAGKIAGNIDPALAALAGNEIQSHQGGANEGAQILINNTGGPVKPGSSGMPITIMKPFPVRADCPYYVGQRILLAGTEKTGAPVLKTDDTSDSGIISKMTWATKAPVAPSTIPIDTLTIELSDSTFADVPNLGAYEDAVIQFDTLGTLEDNGATFTFNIITANLVLKQITRPQSVGGSFSYTSWESERFAQTAASRLQQTFSLPPNCVSSMVVFPNKQGYSARDKGAHLKSYRVRINNIDVVNRPVVVANADTEAEFDGAGVRSGQYTGLIEQWCRQAGLPLRNLSEIAMDSSTDALDLSDILDGKTEQRSCETAMIAFPCNETQGAKNMELIVDAFGDTIDLVIVYKQVVRTINL